MSIAVCLCADTIGYPVGGGHLWEYLNWAMGLRILGCRVIWLEVVSPSEPADQVQANITALRQRLDHYGFSNCLALCSEAGGSLPSMMTEGCLDLDATVEAELLLNLRYSTSSEVVGRFRRSALIDIDPGLLQIWMSKGQINVATHSVYFTTGETVGHPDAPFPDCGLEWHHTTTSVALDWWTPRPAIENAAFTTVTHWTAEEWMEGENGGFRNDKRSGFLPYLDLPLRTAQHLELALCLGPDEQKEKRDLQLRGWRIRDSHAFSSTPWDYQRYIQDSLGEFSCAKPSCVILQNAWFSNRTACYLASGKPAIVQHTGPSRFLPDASGLFRFRNVQEAARFLETVATDYDGQCRLARDLAEEYFDAQKVVGRILERALA